MIQVQLAAIEDVAAVLAGVLVALEYVMSGELYFFFWKPIKHEQYNHPWDADLE